MISSCEIIMIMKVGKSSLVANVGFTNRPLMCSRSKDTTTTLNFDGIKCFVTRYKMLHSSASTQFLTRFHSKIKVSRTCIPFSHLNQRWDVGSYRAQIPDSHCRPSLCMQLDIQFHTDKSMPK